jgi:hypothetical protein
MTAMEPYLEVAKSYQQFVEYSAGDSPCFEEWATGVVGDADVQEWISQLPRVKQQPNLVFAAARWHGVPAPGPYDDLRAALLGDDGTIRQTILTRSTQTNEAGRLATLMPALAQIEGPLALLEVGASAGLCLYPDRYDYRWDPAGELRTGAGPLLTCAVGGPVPVPTAPVDVTWRGGIDRNPLDVHDADAMAWLTNLVWPEQDDRRALLTQAIEVARAEPPVLIRGDLFDALPDALAEAGRHGTPVVFHSAVIAYLQPDDRERFHDLMTGLVADGACHWVSNEGDTVLPRIAATGPRHDGVTFVLGLDGRAVAWTHGHGRTMTWF